MELSELAAIGEAIGGIAVLITLIYLAYQFRQTALIERTAGQRELLSRSRDWVELTTIHPDLVDVLRRELADWDDGFVPRQAIPRYDTIHSTFDFWHWMHVTVLGDTNTV